LGNPIHVQLSAGNVNDVAVAEELLSAISIEGSVVLADKAYGASWLREYIASHQADYCIPPRSNGSEPWFCDWWRYKERHLVECFFLKLKEFRRVATRYDKLACRYLGFVHLACIRILLA
jgi:transposase